MSPWWYWMFIIGFTNGFKQYQVGFAPFFWRVVYRPRGMLVKSANDPSQLIKAGMTFIALGPLRFVGPVSLVDFESDKRFMR